MADPKIITIPLAEPIKVHGEEVTSVHVRRPMPGELRGTNLSLIAAGNVDAMFAVLPRITDPPIPEAVLSSMDFADFADLVMTVVGFFDTSRASITGT